MAGKAKLLFEHPALPWVIRGCVGLAVIGGIVVGTVFLLLQASLPPLAGRNRMDGLGAPALIEFDKWGIPRIQAKTREDAFRVLGFVTARDRLFQMDLLRRSTAGRLAELFGANLMDTDRWHRIMGFSHLASD